MCNWIEKPLLVETFQHLVRIALVDGPKELPGRSPPGSFVYATEIEGIQVSYSCRRFLDDQRRVFVYQVFEPADLPFHNQAAETDADLVLDRVGDG